ncbi:MAG: winged helix-turn-helix transcriptional regulator [Rhodospirillaceae bacterium]|jgi:ArsR family transcriptional regulator|nr:winged helix-turn-helix transcriptional regulator [Rhodospirillaceae bacterium]MBT3909742.1 winged helix-turn-helix transcriptional regulator [Rhodospirillaceae bacterium]MBT5513592.1 winged helix-turn-helix transcriptional regulator [Rhodospirillaceae bacterium]MBT6087569.1 winged helix-turn-helix transcriptional regulator [Rhodospirillaceae bacterium]MBT6609890.1 winged helix-turn-helix transcriptional regulator [Rhodospirillaceae bacterium]
MAAPTETMSLEDVYTNAKLASQFLKALANENRLVILCTLADGEKNVGELEEILGIRQPTLSQQLARLRTEKLVGTRRESKQIYYHLASEEAQQVIGLLYELFCSKDPGAASKPSSQEAA